MPPSAIPPERKLFASYALWRKHVDPDGLVTAGEFAEMDEDDKREAMREIGGAVPAEPGAEGAADDEDEEGDDGEEAGDDEALDDEEGRFVELTDDVVDPRTTDPYA